jgi:hypothetical protein
MRTFTYRVYFTCRPTTYATLSGRNAGDAIRRAKRFARSPQGRISFGSKRLTVLKVERLVPGGEVKLLKTVG